MSPSLKLYWNIPSYIIFYTFVPIALGIFVQRAYRLYRFLRLMSLLPPDALRKDQEKTWTGIG